MAEETANHSDLVTLGEYPEPMEAEMAKLRLESAGIETFLSGDAWTWSRTGSVLSRLPSAALWTAARSSVTSSVSSSRRQSVRTSSSWVVFSTSPHDRLDVAALFAQEAVGLLSLGWIVAGQRTHCVFRQTLPLGCQELEPADHHAYNLFGPGRYRHRNECVGPGLGSTNKTRTPSVWK